MNETFIVIAFAMLVPIAATIGIIILERKNIPAEESIAKIVLVIPILPILPELPAPVLTRWQRLRSKLKRHAPR